MRKRFEIIMSVLMIMIVLVASIYYNSGAKWVFAAKSKDKDDSKEKSEKVEIFKDITIVIDAGHGGYDPGKVGINNKLEKDINLDIALKLRDKCEEAGIKVVMTRTLDETLAETGTNKKISDMENRMKIINAEDVDICISIHQNSYSSKDVKGAQVFYYKESKSGRFLAEKIQASLVEELSEGNKGRVEKANDNYYLIMNVSCPAVIVECGFLSNEEEAKLLSNSQYQDRIVEAIIEGINEYLGNN